MGSMRNMRKIMTAVAISVLLLTIVFAEALPIPKDDIPLAIVVELGAIFEECPNVVAEVAKEKNIDINLVNVRRNSISMLDRMKDLFARLGFEEDKRNYEDLICTGNSKDKLQIEILLQAYSPSLLFEAENRLVFHEMCLYSN